MIIPIAPKWGGVFLYKFLHCTDFFKLVIYSVKGRDFMFQKRLFLLVFSTFAFCFGVNVAQSATPHPCTNTCSPGFYCDNETNSCLPCPAGMSCKDSQMTLCEGNTYQNQEGQSSCNPCPVGTIPFASHIVCSACDSQNFIVTEFNSETVCEKCSGEKPYANSSHTQCVACNGNSEYFADGVCYECPDGQYANTDHTRCFECEPESIIDGVCQKCEPGTYKTDAGCADCHAGYYCNGDGTEKICPKGAFSAAKQSECTLCPEGYATTNDGTGYTIGEDISAICKTKVKAKLKIGGSATSLPLYLKEGRINKSVVKNH